MCGRVRAADPTRPVIGVARFDPTPGRAADDGGCDADLFPEVELGILSLDGDGGRATMGTGRGLTVALGTFVGPSPNFMRFAFEAERVVRAVFAGGLFGAAVPGPVLLLDDAVDDEGANDGGLA